MPTPKAILLSLLVLAPLAGCSDEAAVERNKTNKEFKDAVAAFDEAQSGYVPHHNKAPSDLAAADLDQFQQTQLNEAAQQLQPLIDKGPDTQRVAARRLLADADLANAARASRNATAAWAAATRDSSVLLSMMTSVDLAGTRAKLFETEADEARGLSDQANQDLTTARARQEAAEKKVAELQPQIADLDSKIKSLQQERDAATAEGRSLYDKAFVAKIADQAELYRQSDAAQRKADAADAQARRVEIDRNLKQSEMVIAAKQLELAKEATKNAEDHAHAAEEQVNQTKSNQQAALDRKQKTADEFDKRFADLAKAYTDGVEAGFTAAEEKASHAVDVLSQGAAHTRGEDQRLLQTDLLSTRIMQASIYAQHVVAAASYQRTLALLASQAERSLPGKTVYADAAKQAQGSMSNAYSQGKKAVDDGLSLTTELTQSVGGESATMDAITARRELLTKYGATLTASQTGDAPAPAAE